MWDVLKSIGVSLAVAGSVAGSWRDPSPNIIESPFPYDMTPESCSALFRQRPILNPFQLPAAVLYVNSGGKEMGGRPTVSRRDPKGPA